MARRKHVKNEESAKLIRILAQYGVPQKDLAERFGLCLATFHKYYMDEYSKGKHEAEAKIRQTLFKKAVYDGNTACLIFLCKTRLGMKETTCLDLTSSDGTMSPAPAAVDLSMLTPEQLLALRGELDAHHKA